MGPFELVDLVGLDTRLHILEYLHKTLGDKFRPCPLLAQYVKANRLGRKPDRAVFEIRNCGNQLSNPTKHLRESTNFSESRRVSLINNL
jgi:3-hydroxybutyryl-CoA dehydrogenase